MNFGVANNRVYVVNGEKREETHYFDCEAWGKLADIIRQYANKGKQVMIEGRLKYDSWDGQDGKKQSRIRIVVENLQLLGTASNSGSGVGGSYNSPRDERSSGSSRETTPYNRQDVYPDDRSQGDMGGSSFEDMSDDPF